MKVQLWDLGLRKKMLMKETQLARLNEELDNSCWTFQAARGFSDFWCPGMWGDISG